MGLQALYSTGRFHNMVPGKKSRTTFLPQIAQSNCKPRVCTIMENDQESML